LLCQGEKTVEVLAREASMSVKLTSAHLRELREAHLVETERQGKNICYRLADKAVTELWVQIHMLAEDRFVHRCREQYLVNGRLRAVKNICHWTIETI
jgi:DNA-binding transcriptional ArsR family regulator